MLKEGTYTLLKGSILNGRPILTHGVSTAWTNKIGLRRATTQELAPLLLRPSETKQKPHKCHSMVKFDGIGRQLDSVNRMMDQMMDMSAVDKKDVLNKRPEPYLLCIIDSGDLPDE